MLPRWIAEEAPQECTTSPVDHTLECSMALSETLIMALHGAVPLFQDPEIPIEILSQERHCKNTTDNPQNQNSPF